MDDSVSLRYVPNTPAVAFEAFDDEVVLIHFPSGRYFRLDDVGRAAWKALDAVRGSTRAEIAEAIGHRFEGDVGVIATEIDAFVDGLAENELVVDAATRDASGGTDGESASAADEPSPEADAKRSPFRAPTLEVFTDLEDILLLDPIHDVDETGWPHPNA